MTIEALDPLLGYDREAFLFFNNLGTTTWDGFWLAVSDKWIALPLYVVLLLLSYRALGLRRTLYLLLAVALLVTATDQLANFFKNGVQRLRPCHDPALAGLVRLVKESCGGRFGFYSAHAANSMWVAVFFTGIFRVKYRYAGFLLILWALLVGYSRIYLGVHYPLDVLAGMASGLLLGWLCFRLFTFAVDIFSE